MKKYLFPLSVLFSLSFTTAFADVRINEIAWMGTTQSSGDEWIELYNNGEATRLDDWHIIASDGSPDIVLSGMIGANAYYLIERTDDSTVPTVTADLVAPFGAGLSNGGEVLSLKDASGKIVDTIDGSQSWEKIGGDNLSKDTAQRSAGFWVTAPATPRAQNSKGTSGVSSTPVSTNPASGSTSGSSDAGTKTAVASPTPTPSVSGKSSGGTASSVGTTPYPRSQISIVTERERTLTAGVSAQFSAQGIGLYDEQLANATTHWNFGDGVIGEGATVTHMYALPGTYLAHVEVIFGSLRTTTRVTVSVVAPTVSIVAVSPSPDAVVTLENVGSEVDISGWSLSVQGRQFVFPPHTLIAQNTRVPFPSSVTGLSFGSTDAVVLALDTGREISRKQFVLEEIPEISEISAPVTLESRTLFPKESPTIFSLKASESEAQIHDISASSTISAVGASEILFDRPATPSGESHFRYGYALFGLTLVALAVAVIGRSRSAPESLANAYTIVEE